MSIATYVLFGHKGCGKSYYGKLLSDRLSYPLIETDRLIEARHPGLSCRQIAQMLGEHAFRSLEKQVVLDLDVNFGIIAVGGGTLFDSESCSHLQRTGKLIYLSIDREVLKKRDALPCHYRWSFEKMYLERTLFFEALGAITIDLDDKSDEEIINELVAVTVGQIVRQ